MVPKTPPRWSLKYLDVDLAMVAAIAKSWEVPPEEGDVEKEAEWFREAMSQFCDVAMPRRRVGGPPKKKAVYWWTPEIASLRQECNFARRQYTRNKLRQAASPTTESLDPGLFREVVAALFPTEPEEEARPREDPALVRERTQWSDDLRVTEEELARAVKRMRRKNAAPEPDGVPGRVWAIALSVLGDRLRHLFDRCLQLGRFPTPWKEAGLVLIPKQGKPADDPSAHRPICLIGEVGKLFQRIIASRLATHMSTVSPTWSRHTQYGLYISAGEIDRWSDPTVEIPGRSRGEPGQGGVGDKLRYCQRFQHPALGKD
ncbi:uncharacterized protein LOC105203383 [Solenopsis invicta]|uniref:uncharacterized protein LOC105203383 n=1 Tax=Solenopsis invicta TaxID=13686 RepID=UPI00059623B3|nr:uncharacterized protein LOC105203383 [Solenopsis invicta]